MLHCCPLIHPVHNNWIAKSAEDAMQRVLESDLQTQLAALYFDLTVCVENTFRRPKTSVKTL